ncbi:hypothetical protein TUM12370_09430 [Salmonella enterica subsp. enterica serovar Choleraesuis]|nr:hypothetical protein TUM12370_09430 [Salmonella enterica subsp. enterica serovar Choleraesuis]
MSDISYSALVPAAQRESPHYLATVEGVSDAFTGVQQSLLALIPGFDLDSAIGSQLDIIGLWVGRNRIINAPIDDYFFTLDSETLGFDAGNWKNRFDSDFGYVNLDDSNYRSVLRAKIGANSWDGTNEKLQAILNSIYPKGDIQIRYQDNQDMTMTVFVTGKAIPNITREIIRQGYLAIKPAGVTVSYQISEE